MPEKIQSPTESLEHGVIDLMYFPHVRGLDNEGQYREERCHEPVKPAVDALCEAGMSRVFVTQCKRWSCERRIYCEDTTLDDVLRYTFPYPQYFIGVAGYNPLAIAASVQQAEIGILQHGFRGIYVNAAGYGVAINDRRMYPLYVKALDWHVPVILDVRSETSHAKPEDMAQVAADLPELNFVVAQSDWTADEMLGLLDKLPNLYLCFDTATLLTPKGRALALSYTGQSRCMWGSNGLPWKECLAEIRRLELATSHKFLHENPVKLFGLDQIPVRQGRAFVESQSNLLRVVAE